MSVKRLSKITEIKCLSCGEIIPFNPDEEYFDIDNIKLACPNCDFVIFPMDESIWDIEME